MRLTKQLKAQANNLPFASKMPIKPNSGRNHLRLTQDFSNSDVPSKSVASIEFDENSQPFLSKSTSICQSLPVDGINSVKKKPNSHQSRAKLSTVTTTSNVESYTNNQKYQLKINNQGDDDSLNSNSMQDEEGML